MGAPDDVALTVFAQTYVHGAVRDRMTWINTRANDLHRMLGGVKHVATVVLDHDGDLAELDRSIEYVMQRLAHLRAHVAAVKDYRQAQR